MRGQQATELGAQSIHVINPKCSDRLVSVNNVDLDKTALSSVFQTDCIFWSHYKTSLDIYACNTYIFYPSILLLPILTRG